MIPDFTFAWEGATSPSGPWSHLHVVRFYGREELSRLYRYELTLLARAPAPEVDPHDLVGARATLRIATLTTPEYKLVHGVIVEAEELGPVPEGMLYRAVLMPPIVRAKHRTRCRIFLEKTTREIVNAVLRGEPRLSLEDGAPVVDDAGDTSTFEPATETFCWRVEDPTRIDDPRHRDHLPLAQKDRVRPLMVCGQPVVDLRGRGQIHPLMDLIADRVTGQRNQQLAGVPIDRRQLQKRHG